MPELIKQLTGATLSEASKYGGLLLVAYSIMVFIFSPILGALSDHFGRRCTKSSLRISCRLPGKNG
jgi:DHA1 family tetracycline resistance protein-like MFS transporter